MLFGSVARARTPPADWRILKSSTSSLNATNTPPACLLSVSARQSTASYFCTGGTTGLPKIAVRSHRIERANALQLMAVFGSDLSRGKGCVLWTSTFPCQCANWQRLAYRLGDGRTRRSRHAARLPGPGLI